MVTRAAEILDGVAIVVDPLVAEANGERQPVTVAADQIGDARRLGLRFRIPDAEQHGAVAERRRVLEDAGSERGIEAVQDKAVEGRAQGGQIGAQLIGWVRAGRWRTRIVPAGIEGDEGRPLAAKIADERRWVLGPRRIWPEHPGQQQHQESQDEAAHRAIS